MFDDEKELWDSGDEPPKKLNLRWAFVFAVVMWIIIFAVGYFIVRGM
jgi:hypothetical protein